MALASLQDPIGVRTLIQVMHLAANQSRPTRYRGDSNGDGKDYTKVRAPLSRHLLVYKMIDTIGIFDAI